MRFGDTFVIGRVLADANHELTGIARTTYGK
jgi:hypothetical protein